MSKPARPWFRFYVETVADRKIRAQPEADRWLWPVILTIARASPKPGVLFVGTQPATIEDLMDIGALKKATVVRALKYYEEQTMILKDETYRAYRVTNWDSRQFESDDTTLRTTKHRSKERSKDVLGNAPEAEAETDIYPPTPFCGQLSVQPVDNQKWSFG